MHQTQIRSTFAAGYLSQMHVAICGLQGNQANAAMNLEPQGATEEAKIQREEKPEGSKKDPGNRHNLGTGGSYLGAKKEKQNCCVRSSMDAHQIPLLEQ